MQILFDSSKLVQNACVKVYTNLCSCSLIEIYLVGILVHLLFPTFAVILGNFGPFQKLSFLLEIAACCYLYYYYNVHLHNPTTKDLMRGYASSAVLIVFLTLVDATFSVQVL